MWHIRITCPYDIEQQERSYTIDIEYQITTILELYQKEMEKKMGPSQGGTNKRGKHVSFKPAKEVSKDDYSNHYVHTGFFPHQNITNTENPVVGYPKLQKLLALKQEQNKQHATTPFGCKVDIDQMVPTINHWIKDEQLTFDVVMIGCLTDNQFIYPLLTQLALDKLISKPGFLFIWASAQKINELNRLLSNESWAKKFRRSEELVFVPIDKDSPFYPGLEEDDNGLVDKMQWHCWMCITGTVRRSTDGHLIHCNIDTDLSIETKGTRDGAVPSHLYKVVENFATSTKRLHIIPARTGTETPVRLRPGWVVMSPDIILNNFSPERYRREISMRGCNIPQTPEIENLRPKSPIQKV